MHHKGDDGLSALNWATHFNHTAVEAALRAHIAKQEAQRSGTGAPRT